MRADPVVHDAIVHLVHETYRRLSTPGSDPAARIEHPHVAVAGSGPGELACDAEAVRGMCDAVSSWAYSSRAEAVTVRQEGDIARAQILGSIRTRREGREDDVHYWTTGVFARDVHGWRWRSWGGADPQAGPRV